MYTVVDSQRLLRAIVIGQDIILTLTLCATDEHILSFAACMGNEYIMTMLMDAGASTRVQDSRGMDQSAPSLSSLLPHFTKRFRKIELWFGSDYVKPSEAPHYDLLFISRSLNLSSREHSAPHLSYAA